MIVAHRRQLEAICRQRGYDLAAAMACVVSQDGDQWTIDETHPAYPRRRVAARVAGPGTHLKRLLAGWPLRITASATCSCNARAREMDARGCDWCDDNLDTIVGWLRHEAEKRRLLFLDAAGRLLVRRAINAARQEQARAEKAREAEGRSPAV